MCLKLYLSRFDLHELFYFKRQFLSSILKLLKLEVDVMVLDMPYNEAKNSKHNCTNGADTKRTHVVSNKGWCRGVLSGKHVHAIYTPLYPLIYSNILDTYNLCTNIKRMIKERFRMKYTCMQLLTQLVWCCKYKIHCFTACISVLDINISVTELHDENEMSKENTSREPKRNIFHYKSSK